MNYEEMNDYELKRCLIDLHNLIQRSDYPRMKSEYEARIATINAILKQRRNQAAGL